MDIQMSINMDDASVHLLHIQTQSRAGPPCLNSRASAPHSFSYDTDASNNERCNNISSSLEKEALVDSRVMMNSTNTNSSNSSSNSANYCDLNANAADSNYISSASVSVDSKDIPVPGNDGEGETSLSSSLFSSPSPSKSKSPWSSNADQQDSDDTTIEASTLDCLEFNLDPPNLGTDSEAAIDTDTNYNTSTGTDTDRDIDGNTFRSLNSYWNTFSKGGTESPATLSPYEDPRNKVQAERQVRTSRLKQLGKRKFDTLYRVNTNTNTNTTMTAALTPVTIVPHSESTQGGDDSTASSSSSSSSPSSSALHDTAGAASTTADTDAPAHSIATGVRRSTRTRRKPNQRNANANDLKCTSIESSKQKQTELKFVKGSIPGFWECSQCRHLPISARAKHSVLFQLHPPSLVSPPAQALSMVSPEVEVEVETEAKSDESLLAVTTLPSASTSTSPSPLTLSSDSESLSPNDFEMGDPRGSSPSPSPSPSPSAVLGSQTNDDRAGNFLSNRPTVQYHFQMCARAVEEARLNGVSPIAVDEDLDGDEDVDADVDLDVDLDSLDMHEIDSNHGGTSAGDDYDYDDEDDHSDGQGQGRNGSGSGSSSDTSSKKHKKKKKIKKCRDSGASTDTASSAQAKPKKKRGRPRKSEAEKRKTLERYNAKRRSSKSKTATTSSKTASSKTTKKVVKAAPLVRIRTKSTNFTGSASDLKSKIKPLPDSILAYVQESSALASTSTSTSNYNKEDLDGISNNNGLLLESDLNKTASVDLVVIAQLNLCSYKKEEDITPHLRQKPLPEGFPGVMCKHCQDSDDNKKWFYNSFKQMGTGMPKMEQHLMNQCEHCPEDVKRHIRDRKGQEDLERALLRMESEDGVRITRRSYASLLFNRLMATSNCGDFSEFVEGINSDCNYK